MLEQLSIFIRPVGVQMTMVRKLMGPEHSQNALFTMELCMDEVGWAQYSSGRRVTVVIQVIPAPVMVTRILSTQYLSQRQLKMGTVLGTPKVAHQR